MSMKNDVFWELITDALYTDGAHHKQWYLEQIAEHMAGEKDYKAWKKMTEIDWADGGDWDGAWEPGIAP